MATLCHLSALSRCCLRSRHWQCQCRQVCQAPRPDAPAGPRISRSFGVMSCVSPRQRGRFSPCRRLGSRHQLYRRLCQLTCHLASIMVTGAWPTAARLCSVVHVCSHTILSPLSVTASQSERHVAPPAPHAPWGCSGIPTELQSQTVCQLKHGHTGHTHSALQCVARAADPLAWL